MSYTRFSEEGLPSRSSPTNGEHPDNQLRRRAVSCSSMSDAGSARSMYIHSPSSATYIPTCSRPLGPVLALSSTQTTPIFGEDDYHNAEYAYTNDWGRTQDNLLIFAPQGSPGTSALEFVPGPPSQHPHGAVHFDHQQDQDPSTNSLVAGDPSLLSTVSSECPYAGPRLTVTQPPPEPLNTVCQASPTDYESLSALSPPWPYSNQMMASSPSSPCQFIFLRPPQGPEIPSSPSALSSGSPSSLSFSNLTLSSPRSSIGEMDDDFLSRSNTERERQGQGEAQWEKDGLVADQSPIPPSSPSWTGIRPELPGNGPFLTMSRPTPALDMAGATDFGLAGISDVNAAIPGLNLVDIPRTISRYPQSSPCASFYPLMDLPSGSNSGGSFIPNPSAEFFSILPRMSGHQQSGAFGPNTLSHLHSGPSVPLEVAGPPFSDQVNESYEKGPLDDHVSLFQGVGTSCSLGTTSAEIARENANNNPRPRHNDAATRKKGGWCNEISRTKEMKKEFHNRLLHVSISALENNGLVPRASSLRDTLRLIIRDCFPRCDPTRQQIVDLLFRALPEGIRTEVVELEVKKYYKDRVGHILSAPPNKNKKIFVNLNGGRWTLGETA